ncbi:MAG: EamA family transporter [Henriciella sp.]|nr:EamA family transporter [Henriciella sp.]
MSSSLFPIALCLLSAVTVAATNLFVKRGGDVLSTRMIVSIAMALSVVPFAPFVPLPTPAVWGALAISLVVHWFYQFAMIRALHRGDLSLVFPVMRGLAPLLTAITATFVLNETPGVLGWLGLMIATGALIVFAMPEEKGGKHPPIKQAALFWAMVTALGIAFYSVADANGTRIAADASTLFTFVVWLFLLDWIGITSVMFWVRKGRVWSDIAPQIRDGTIGGLLGTVSYGAALWAFTLTEAANVTAIRETSVVFGAIFGAVFLKEAFGPRRILAASGLAFGLMLLEFAP